MARRFRFGLPFRSRTSPEVRVEHTFPVGGLHSGVPAEAMPPGFSPDCENFVSVGGQIAPREGYAPAGGDSVSRPLGAFRAFDVNGQQCAIAASESSVAFIAEWAPSWSELSYVSSFSVDDLPSGTSRTRWHGVSIYDASINENLAVFTNNVNFPKMVVLNGSEATYSDLSGVNSLFSTARSVEAFDNRLLWFNVAIADDRYPQRVVWSTRGLPQDYQLANGAGFEDLMDMRGVGQKIIAQRDGFLLFSDVEVWRGRRRGDIFVFDFFPIERQRGCPYPATIANTPYGVLFVSDDLEVHAVVGDQVVPVGSGAPGEPSRIREFLRANVMDPSVMWAVFNTTTQRYELYFNSGEDACGLPTRALYIDLARNSVWPQRFATPFAVGFEMKALGDTGPTWDEIEGTWDDFDLTWDDLSTPGAGNAIFAISSVGSSFVFSKSEQKDDGEDIVAYWRSGGLASQEAMRYDNLLEVRVSAEALSDTSVGVRATGRVAGDFGSEMTLSLAAHGFRDLRFPVRAVGFSPQYEVRTTADGHPRIGRLTAIMRDSGHRGDAV